MSTEVAKSNPETVHDPYQGPMMLISSDVVPALTAKTTWVTGTYRIVEEPGQAEVVEFIDGHYEHRLGPTLTEEERLSVVNDALLYYRIGQTGVSATHVQAAIERYAGLTKSPDALSRSHETVSWLIQTALAVVDPDRETGEARLLEMFGDQALENK